MSLMEELKEASIKLSATLDHISNKTVNLENSLRACKIFLEFEFKVDKNISIAWKPDPNSMAKKSKILKSEKERLEKPKARKNFRIFIIDTEENLCLPLIETKINIKLKYSKYLNDFTIALIENFKSITKEYKLLYDKMNIQ